MLAVSPAGGPPALCTRMSRPPIFWMAAATSASASPARPRSATTASTEAPVSWRMREAASSMRPASRLAITTRHPSWARARAHA